MLPTWSYKFSFANCSIWPILAEKNPIYMRKISRLITLKMKLRIRATVSNKYSVPIPKKYFAIRNGSRKILILRRFRL